MDYQRPHPAKAVLAARRISVRAVADRLEMNEQHVSRVLNGHAPTSGAFRTRLAVLLDMPEQLLFHADPPQQRAVRYPGDSTLGSAGGAS